MANQTETRKINIVFGKVTDGSNRPLANLKVTIYDVDMREWQTLAETFTNKEGKYELKWTHDQLSGREKKEAENQASHVPYVPPQSHSNDFKTSARIT